jgi:hypothetical protein
MVQFDVVGVATPQRTYESFTSCIDAEPHQPLNN